MRPCSIKGGRGVRPGVAGAGPGVAGIAEQLGRTSRARHQSCSCYGQLGSEKPCVLTDDLDCAPCSGSSEQQTQPHWEMLKVPLGDYNEVRQKIAGIQSRLNATVNEIRENRSYSGEAVAARWHRLPLRHAKKSKR